MEIKASEYTPYLVIGLIVVTIIRFFYDPLNVTDAWEVMKTTEDMSLPIPVMKGILIIFMPIMMSIVDLMGYLFDLAKAMNDEKMVILFVAEITCFGYMILTYCLEKFHAYWHEEEGTFAMCVDMLCIENIVMYIFSLFFYAVSRILQTVGIPDEVYAVLGFLLALPLLWGIIFQLLYFMVGVIIEVGIPVLIMGLLANVLGETVASWIMLVLFVFFSQVIWRLCSEVIYDKLLTVFSFHRMSLLD